MSSNEELLRKADLAIADLTAGGGVLQIEQARTFVRKLIDQPTLVAEARTVSMNSPSRRINKIGFGTRILHAPTDGQNTALAVGQRSKPTFEKVDMEAKEYKAEVRIPYDVMEDNIESATAANNEASNTGPGGLRSTILTLIAERAALDVEEIAMLSDTGSGDPDLALQHGWLKLANLNGNIYNYGGAAVSKKLFKNGKKTLPTKYLRQLGAMRHYVSHDQETEYRDTLADRATALGDSVITQMSNTVAYGSPVRPVALMPEAQGLFTNPQNLIFGIWRRISLEFDKDITKGEYIIVLTTRMAFQIEETEALVQYTNIGTVA